MIKINPSVEIASLYGGYLVKAKVEDEYDPEEFERLHSVFTDVDLMLAYVKKSLIALEGSGEPLDKGAFANMKIGGSD